jgi:hypothetical protein
MNAIESAYELEHGEPWLADEAPQEYEEPGMKIDTTQRET